jgi:hypothetical protein
MTIAPRQLSRLYTLPEGNSSREYAYRQLSGAIIFHWREALRAARWNIRHSLTFRCSVCGRRHNQSIREKLFACSYGWWWTVRYALPDAWAAGLHGED